MNNQCGSNDGVPCPWCWEALALEVHHDDSAIGLLENRIKYSLHCTNGECPCSSYTGSKWSTDNHDSIEDAVDVALAGYVELNLGFEIAGDEPVEKIDNAVRKRRKQAIKYYRHGFVYSRL